MPITLGPDDFVSNKNTKITPVKIPPAIKSIAFEAIKVRAIRSTDKMENFSEFIRNLITEEWDRQKEYIKSRR